MTERGEMQWWTTIGSVILLGFPSFAANGHCVELHSKNGFCQIISMAMGSKKDDCKTFAAKQKAGRCGLAVKFLGAVP